MATGPDYSCPYYKNLKWFLYRDFPSSYRMEPSQEHEAMSVRSGQQQGGRQRVRTEGTNLLLFKPSQVPPVVEAHLFSLPVLHKGGS